MEIELMDYLLKNEQTEMNVADVFFRSIIDGAVQSPVTGITQLGNKAIGTFTGKDDFIPELRLVEPPYQFKSGTPEWYVQQVGYGVGSAIDLAVILSLTRGRAPNGVMLKEGSKFFSKQEGRTALRNFAVGFGYEGITRPIHEDEMDNFWTARLRNATVGGAFLATLGTSRSACDTLLSRVQLSPAPLRLATRLGMDAVSTIPASVVQAEATSLLTNGELASWDEFKATAGANMIAGFTMRRPFILPPVEKTGLNVNQEISRFKSLAERVGIQDAEQNMTAFETRARNASISKQEIARTYHNLSKLADPDRSGKLSPELRKELATQALYQAANPTSIDQGNNNTCSVNTAEGYLYTTSPADPIRVITKLSLEGQFQTHDGSTIRLP
ncbi:MAG: hypothetical protein K2Z81_25675, partial [Cyanobacteria bacterium]|nr:hypothetical protein [Cyanobacteriota bacterium]